MTYDSCTALWASVMATAVADLDARLLSLRRAAQKWMYQDRSDQPGSFLWICDALELDPDLLRQHCLTRAGRKKLRSRNVGNRYTKKMLEALE